MSLHFVLLLSFLIAISHLFLISESDWQEEPQVQSKIRKGKYNIFTAWAIMEHGLNYNKCFRVVKTFIGGTNVISHLGVSMQYMPAHAKYDLEL